MKFYCLTYESKSSQESKNSSFWLLTVWLQYWLSDFVLEIWRLERKLCHLFYEIDIIVKWRESLDLVCCSVRAGKFSPHKGRTLFHCRKGFKMVMYYDEDIALKTLRYLEEHSILYQISRLLSKIVQFQNT